MGLSGTPCFLDGVMYVYAYMDFTFIKDVHTGPVLPALT